MAVDLRKTAAGTVYGLGTAMAFSISPIFVRLGMRDGHSAEIALAIGMTGALLSYGVVLLLFDRKSLKINRVSGLSPFLWEAAAALAIVIGTWLRYLALDLIPLGIVSALGRINILVILLLVRKEITWRVWAGGALMLAGTLLLSF